MFDHMGRKPLSPLSLLTVRCVFFCRVVEFFHTMLWSWGRVPTAGCESHRDALCQAPSPALLCGFRQRPNAHHPVLCPTSRLHNSLQLTLLPQPVRNNGVFWVGQIERLWWSCSPAAHSFPLNYGEFCYIATGWSHFLGGPDHVHLQTHTQRLSLIESSPHVHTDTLNS